MTEVPCVFLECARRPRASIEVRDNLQVRSSHLAAASVGFAHRGGQRALLRFRQEQGNDDRSASARHSRD